MASETVGPVGGTSQQDYLTIIIISLIQEKEIQKGAMCNTQYQWLFLVPLKGGIGGIVHPPLGSIQVVYKWFILPIGGLYATDPTF